MFQQQQHQQHQQHQQLQQLQQQLQSLYAHHDSYASNSMNFANVPTQTHMQGLGAESMFFNPNTAQEICPGIWLGPYTSLLNDYLPNGSSSSFLTEKNVKMIINCGSTMQFLDLVENSPNVSISSDIIILSLDPAFDYQSELIKTFNTKFNRVLQNYLLYFYTNNPVLKTLIHSLPQSHDLNLSSPILSGSNLKIQFFKIIRLISLFKHVFNQDLQVLFLSETGNSNLSSGLCIAYLMDTYKYNLQNSFKLLQLKRPTISELRTSYYEDLLIIENLKKFYLENIELKLQNPSLLVSKFKRGQCDIGQDGQDVDGDDDNMRDEILVGAGADNFGRGLGRKRRFR